MRRIILKNKKMYVKNKQTNELREWDPFRSKVAAGIKKDLFLEIKENDDVLYLGAAEGYTVSFISDILDKGNIYAIDISAYSMQNLLLKANEKKNIIPILADCNKIEEYKDFIKEVDIIIQDIAQKNQVEILIKNSDEFLKKEGYVLLSLKLSAISQKNIKEKKEDQISLLKSKFRIIKQKRLDPFEKKHVLILAQKK